MSRLHSPFSPFAARAAVVYARLTPLRQRIWASSLPELFVLLLAALPRFWRLEYHSIWFDEAVSLDWARLGPAHIWPGTLQLLRDKHPPAYYLALHYWQTLLSWFGAAERDAALRIFGVLIGILLVWGVLRLVTRLSGRATALTAGAFTALAPVLVWYSQELRMFQPAATANRLGRLLPRRCPRTPFIRRRHHLAGTPQPPAFYAGSVSWPRWFSRFNSYLYAAFFLPGLGLTVFLLARRRSTFNRRYVLEAVAAFAIVTLLFLPLARSAWTVNSASGTPGAPFADFLPNLWRQLRIFTVWYSGWPSTTRAAAVLFFALLLFAGLLLPGDRRRDARPYLWLWVGSPLLIGSALLATNSAIFREDRYFLFLAPFVLWAAAHGVIAIGRWRPAAGALSGLAALVLLAASLPVLWTPPLFRENWRAAADYINAYQRHRPARRHRRPCPPLLPLSRSRLVPAPATRRGIDACLRQLQRPSELRAGRHTHRRPSAGSCRGQWRRHPLAGPKPPRRRRQSPAGSVLAGWKIPYRHQAVPGRC